jgi:IS605 OrfB family transposase
LGGCSVNHLKSEVMKATRISHSSSKLAEADYEQLKELARRLGILRSEVWNEYGSLKGVGVDGQEIRDLWNEERSFNVQDRLWMETLRDVVGNIKASQEAAKEKVRKAIPRREHNKEAQKVLYTALKADIWTTDPFLRRQMRKHFKHGHTKVRNQIVLDAQCYTATVVKGKACLHVMGLIPRNRVSIPLTTNRLPSGMIRLILKDNGRIAVHHTVDVEENCVTRPHGDKTLGVDKGYTEAFTDSKGDRHGKTLGTVLATESDYLKVKYQRRNHLRAIAEAKPQKRDKIVKNNLGRKKLNARKRVHTEHIRDIAFKAVHSVLDDASTVVAEDLKAPIKSHQKRSKDTKRRLSGWVKGLLATALLCASQRRGASLVLVNAAYTSQMDCQDGSLSGKRQGDSFYRTNGEVLDADWNAARNILARKDDPEIGLFTPYKEVKEILLRRTSSPRLGLLNLDSSCAPTKKRQRRAKD